MEAVEDGQELTAVFTAVVLELTGQVDTPELRDRLGRVAEEPAELVGHLILHFGQYPGATEAVIVLICALERTGAAFNEEHRSTGEGPDRP